MDDLKPIPGSIAVNDGKVIGGDNPEPVTEENTQENQKPEPQPEQQPEKSKEKEGLLAGKYKTEEDLDKGLQELLKTFGSKEEAYKALEKSKGLDQLKTSKPEESEATEEAKEIFGQQDLEKYYEEFLENGSLTDESKKTLKSKGIDPATAEAAIAGTKAQKDAYVNQVFEMAGGEEGYKEITKWLNNNVDKESLQAFEIGVVDLGQKAPQLAKFIIEGAKAMRQNASPELISGSMASGAIDKYNSKAEFEADVAKYMETGDSKLEAEVWRKAKASGYLD